MEKESQEYALKKEDYINQKTAVQKKDSNIIDLGLSGIVTGFICTAVNPPLGLGIMAVTASYAVYKHSKYTQEIKNLDEKILELEIKNLDKKIF